MDSKTFLVWPRASFSHELVTAFSKVFAFLVPAHKDRIPFTYDNAYLIALPPLVLILMAGLARMRNTFAIRLAFLPLAVTLTASVCFGHLFSDPELATVNYFHGVFGCFNTISIVFMALSPKGVLKMNEVAPGVLKAPAKSENGSSEKSDVSSSAPPPPTTVYSFISNALELIWSPRGVGWQFGTGSGVYIHKDWRNLDSKSVFMRQTLVSIVKWFIALDVSNAIVEQAGIRVPGGTLFGRGRNAVESLLIAMLLTHATNFVILSGFNLIQLVCSLIALAPRPAKEWPIKDEGWGPLIVAPWDAESLHDWNGVRWQQVFRQYFLVLGGYPLHFIFSRLARVFAPPNPKSGAPSRLEKEAGYIGLFIGVFGASAALHDLPFYFNGPTIDPETGAVLNPTGLVGAPVYLFFGANVIGMIFERQFRAWTGRRVHGTWGKIWVSLIGGIGFTYMLEGMYNAGAVRGLAMPTVISPTKSFAIPLIRKYLAASA